MLSVCHRAFRRRNSSSSFILIKDNTSLFHSSPPITTTTASNIITYNGVSATFIYSFSSSSTSSSLVVDSDNGTRPLSSSSIESNAAACTATNALKSYKLMRRRLRFRRSHSVESKKEFSAIELALDSVVKIFTVSSSPNYFLPWQNKSQRESMGSGMFLLQVVSIIIRF